MANCINSQRQALQTSDHNSLSEHGAEDVERYWQGGPFALLNQEFPHLALPNDFGEDGEKELPALVQYVRGRSAMAAVLSAPANSAGLTFAYRLLERIDQYGVAYAGADDYLSNADLDKVPGALPEIENEVERLAANPESAVSQWHLDNFKRFVRDWSHAKGLEQAVDPLFENVMIEVRLQHVFQALLASSSEFVAHQLDRIGHPALAAAILEGFYGVDFAATLRLLKFASPVFDEAGNWNRKWAARLVLHCLEGKIIGSASGSHHRLNTRVGALQDSKAVEARVAEVVDVLRYRADGPGLFIEWIAHLINEIRNREGFSSPKPDAMRTALGSLLDAIHSQYGNEQWLNATDAWRLFGGSNSRILEEGSITPEALPAWTNLHGQRDIVAPLATAIVLSYADETRTQRADISLSWLRAIYRDIEGKPQLDSLRRRPRINESGCVGGKV
jgi:hypothetical protein